MTTYWHNLCPRCRNRALCIYLKRNKVLKLNEFCPALTAYLDNDTPSKEPLASDLIGEGYNDFVNRDYKAVLCDGKDSKDEVYACSLDDIKDMPCGSDMQIITKAIMAMMWFGLPKKKIMHLLRIGRTFFYKAVKEAREASDG